MFNKSARYWCVTDLETTGLIPGKHEIIQIGRVIVDAVEKRIYPELTMSCYVLPTRWDQRDLVSMKINRLTLPKLQGEGIPLDQALRAFVDGLDWQQTVLAGWGVAFEENFLKLAFETTGLDSPIHYKTVDIRSLAHLPRAKEGLVDYMGLGDACVHYGVPFDEAQLHDALYDTTETAELAVKLLLRA